jgi:hypothetical protein
VPIIKKLKVIIDFPTLSHEDEFNSSDEGTMIKKEVTKKWKAMAIKVVSSSDIPKLVVSNRHTIRNVIGLVVYCFKPTYN